jgi:hypothetical protein
VQVYQDGRTTASQEWSRREVGVHWGHATQQLPVRGVEINSAAEPAVHVAMGARSAETPGENSTTRCYPHDEYVSTIDSNLSRQALGW